MKKPVIIPIIALILITIFVVLGKKQGWIGKEFRQKVTVEKAQYRTLTETITANGKIKPEVEVKISSDVSGEIIELKVKEGDEVHKDQILARIQPDIYQRNKEKMDATVKSAEANLAQAKATFHQKKLSYQRNKDLWQYKTISQSDYEQARADYHVAKANVQSAEASLINASASLNEAIDNLSKTTIYAPTNGIISRLNVEKGERVVGTAQFEGTELMTVANLNQMEVVVEVNENDIIRVGLKDTCLIEVDAYLKKKFKGIVTQIANSAKIEGASTDQITNFEVKVYILPESYEGLSSGHKKNFYPFRPGMSATVDIQTQTRHDVLTVHIQCVTTRPDSLSTDSINNQSLESEQRIEVVFVYNEGAVTQRKVSPGIQDSKFIEIQNGLDENENIVSGPYSAISRKLKDGDAVEVTDDLFGNNKK
ncbi:efflux RND transporter periplasmic adaptor subunit [Marinilabiliaceae bacterium JC017]|nr:efflux RND transporter periplasmic adaptor subunit [Marinilabiliaceae bacterium JC017]